MRDLNFYRQGERQSSEIIENVLPMYEERCRPLRIASAIPADCERSGCQPSAPRLDRRDCCQIRRKCVSRISRNIKLSERHERHADIGTSI